MAKAVKPNSSSSRIKTPFTFDDVNGELTDRQQLFCMEYIRCKFNATQAAIKAGYEQRSAAQQAERLLRNDDIQNYVSALKKDLAKVVGVSAYDIAQQYMRIGFSDIRNIFDKNGALIDIKKLPEEAAANISSIEVVENENIRGPKKVTGKVKKIKVYNKIDALQMLSKMLGFDGVQKVAVTDSEGNDLPQKIDYTAMSAEDLETMIRLHDKYAPKH